MKWKAFFEPSPGKIILFLVLFSLLPVFAYQEMIMCEAELGGKCPPYIVGYASLLSASTLLFEPFLSLDIQTIALLPLGIFISYTISCWISWKIRSLTPENKQEFYEFYRVTRGKIIIAALGWLSVVYVALNILSGLYGGTMNFPPILSFIYDYYGLIVYALFPFSLLTIWILFNANMGLLWLFMLITQARFDIGSGAYLSGLSAGAGIFVVSALIIEWYWVACLIVWIYKSLRKEKPFS